MSSQGPNLPSNATTINQGLSNSWTNVLNITAQDGAVATISFNSGVSTSGDPIISFSHGFTIPAGATINGITMTFRRAQTAGAANSIQDSSVFLTKNGNTGSPTTVGTNHSAGARWPGSLTDATFGSGADLWGTTWTPADINSAGFGAYIAPLGTASVGVTGGIDDVVITVTYTPAASTAQSQMFMVF